MPTSEAQKRANKKWYENNKQKAFETHYAYADKNRDKINKIARKSAQSYYYRNRDKILEKARQRYIQKNTELWDLYHSMCQPDDPITEDGSTDSECNSETSISAPSVPEPIPQPPAVVWVHPFFQK